MQRWLVPLLAAGMVACRGPQQFSAPAPRTALDCAVREAERIGYRRLEGQRETGVVRMGRYIPPPPGREVTDPEVRLSDVQGPRLRDPALESQIRISHRRGSLRVAVLSNPEPNRLERTTDPSGAVGDAQQILAECTTSEP